MIRLTKERGTRPLKEEIISKESYHEKDLPQRLPEDGFRFGQVVWNDATTVDGVGPNGLGIGLGYGDREDLEMCECWIQKIDGKWRVAKEASIRSNAAYRRVLGDS